MTKITKLQYLFLILLSFTLANCRSSNSIIVEDSGSILAFPEAEGFGAYSLGGRGGDVIYVTNLNDSGEGSLRWAVEQQGARTIVFSVSGIIELSEKLIIENPYITIAGQTAPGDGICLKGGTFQIETHNVIIRYLRVRLGDATQGQGSLQGKDAISISSGYNIIVDHCSASWSLDEVLSASTHQPDLTNVTVQWCFITEALNPDGHSFGSLIRGSGGAKYSYLHNLYAHNRGRNPRPGNYDSHSYKKDPDGLLLDFRNNLVYNWGGGHAGYNQDSKSVTHLNYVGNYLIPGINSEDNGIAYATGSAHNKAYFAGNYYNRKLPDDPWDLVNFRNHWSEKEIESYKQDTSFETGPIKTEDAKTAYERILKTGGAIMPKRDVIDQRIVNDVENGTGNIISSQTEVGGWPELYSRPAPQDSDHDGMPDLWEKFSDLDPANPDDRNQVDKEGYTMLEKYLNTYALRPRRPVSLKNLLNNKPEWFSSEEAVRIADNILVYQHETGGWPKRIDMTRNLTEKDKAEIITAKKHSGTKEGEPTIDNWATTREMLFLAKVYDQTGEERFKQSFLKGLDYIFNAQYKNGGWPQFYPLVDGYYTHITYNDDAMVNVMRIMQRVFNDSDEFKSLQLSAETKESARNAFDKGIECILKTQIYIDGKPTVWCAQHDENTFLPAKARSYELKSFSGGESTGIVLLLMSLDNPSEEIIASIEGAVSWFENHKIEGLKVTWERDESGKHNKIIVKDDNAKPLWGRFCDLETEKPFFCSRDGIKKDSLSEISAERRNGYKWYTDAPQEVLDEYPEWKQRIGKE